MSGFFPLRGTQRHTVEHLYSFQIRVGIIKESEFTKYVYGRLGEQIMIASEDGHLLDNYFF